MSFRNKVVVITGASSGIGAATAILFSKEGAEVVINGRNEAKLKRVAQECAKVGGTPLVVRADVSNEKEASSILEQTIQKYGKLDVLVNNAGIIGIDGILGGKILSAYDTFMNNNLRPVVHLTSLAVPHLIKTRGNIVNVSSVLGSKATSSMLAYSVSKAGMDHFSRGAALELAESGVRVNIVSPGPVVTDLWDNTEHEPQWDDWGKGTPLKKVSYPEEIADLIMFLASDKARSITGANHYIENGLVIS